MVTLHNLSHCVLHDFNRLLLHVIVFNGILYEKLVRRHAPDLYDLLEILHVIFE